MEVLFRLDEKVLEKQVESLFDFTRIANKRLETNIQSICNFSDLKVSNVRNKEKIIYWPTLAFALEFQRFK